MWLKVLDKAPHEGTMTEIVVDDKELLIASSKGRLFCVVNRCPHEDIKLTLGCIKDNRIKCSLHGYSFDLETGDSSDTDVDSMKVFNVKQENTSIYIQI
jgi:3-phenylpropionate/trans-cinnamate dioxygenase ferredoxin subunit